MAGETVLVVDDRLDNLRFMREYVLATGGYEMLDATNGLDALKIIQKHKLDLIISDIMMPKMGGLELLETMRQQGRDIPTILMTFHGSEETAVQAFRLGARDYIIKPFAIDEMLNAIDRALAESRLRLERDQLTRTLLTVNQQLEGRLQELRFLYGIGRSVTSLQDLEAILKRIVEAAVYLTKAEEGSLMLLEPDTGELYLRAARDMGEKQARNFRIKVQDSIAGQVIRTGRPVMIGGHNTDDSFRVKTGYFVKSLLNIPLKVADRVIGVLAVNNKTILRAFSESQLQSLTALADYASIAIENARLYRRLTSEASLAEQSSKELQEEILARDAELKDVSLQLLKTEKLAALGYMGGGIAKAIEGPIKTILNNLQLLSKEINPEHQKRMVSMAKEAYYCQQVIQNLLDFSGQREFSFKKADINELIQQAWSNFARHNQYEHVRLHRELAPNPPPVLVDIKQVKRAFLYLFKYIYRSMANGGKLHIRSLFDKDDKEEMIITLQDTSESIPEKELHHLFDPFYQTQHESQNQTLGMELPITYGIIIRHQGLISAESKPNQGTTFTIRLPVHQQENQEQKPE